MLTSGSQLRPIASTVLRFMGTLLAPGGNDARLSILMYHRVLPQPDPMLPDDMDARAFERQMTALSSHFHVLPLHEAVTRLQKASLPARAACITFDDGYADNAEVALPILQRLGLHATFFIATGYLDGGRMWNDSIIETVRRAPGPRLDLSGLTLGDHPIETMTQRREAAMSLISALKYLSPEQRRREAEKLSRYLSVETPDQLMMQTKQVRALHNAGMDIGGHTVNHPILTRVDNATARAEIADGRDSLESIVGGRVSLFAYPNGRPRLDYNADHVNIVKQLGFSAAVSTASGAARASGDPYQLPRFAPWDEAPARFVMRLLKNYRESAAAQV